MIQIEFSRDELEAICRRRAVKRLALFGSVLRDDFEGKRIYNIYDELTALFGGRKIDLVEPEFLSPRMRRHILEHTEELYAA